MSSISEPALRRLIVTVGRRLYQQGLVVGTDGNISARINSRRLLITPAGACKGTLSATRIVSLDLSQDQPPRRQGRQGESKDQPRRVRTSLPSSETLMHIAIYQARPEVRAIIHAHPPYATCFAASSQGLDADLLTETRLLDGPVGRVARLLPGSRQLARQVGRTMTRCNYCLLAAHGAVAVGHDLFDALHRLERLEFLARVTWLCRSLR